MFDSVSRSDPAAGPSGGIPPAVRGDSEIVAAFAAADGRPHVATLFERGALRLRYPRADDRREAVVVNTGGGITGGDRLAIALEIAAGAEVCVTSQAAEKIYRSDGPPARIETRLRLVAGAALDWLPQETILYDGACAERSLRVEMSAGAQLTIVEQVMLGRAAHGEVLRSLHWRDRWRVSRDGRLLLAEDVRLEGDVAALMDRPALGAGARGLATILHVAGDAEARLPLVREALARSPALSGASAWNGMLVARIAAPAFGAVRDGAMAAVMAITGRPMPRAWGC
jgi:urease accessory protein